MAYQGKESLIFPIAADSGVTIFHLFIFLIFSTSKARPLVTRETGSRSSRVREEKKGKEKTTGRATSFLIRVH